MSLLQRQDLQRGVVEREPVALVAEALLAAQQADDHAQRLVLAVALQHRVDAERARVATAARRGPLPNIARPLGHVVELHDALGDVERVVVRAARPRRCRADRCVRWPAAARNISGEAIISQPLEWCSPHQNSSNSASDPMVQRDRQDEAIGVILRLLHGEERFSYQQRMVRAQRGRAPTPAGAGRHADGDGVVDLARRG